MKLWQAMLLAGAAWVGTAGALRAAEVDAEADAAADAVENAADGVAEALTLEQVEEPAAEEATVRDEAGDESADGAAAEETADAASGAEIDSLIKQLGAEDFNDREAAVAKLKALGPPALPALRKAMGSTDPEVASRADAVIRDLERPSPQRAARMPAVTRRRGIAPAGVHVRMRVQNGKRQVEVEEPGGRTITIHDGPGGGIEMSVTGEIDGERVTQDFKADTPEELRRQNAEAFELYDRYAGRGGGMGVRGGPPGAMIMPGRVFVRPGGGIARVGPPPGAGRVVDPFDDDAPDDLRQLRALIERQMNDAQMPEAQRREMAGLLEQLREAGEGDPLLDDDDAQIQRRIEALDNRARGGLRHRLKSLKLPDPGDAPPPPAAGGLGIEVLEDPEEGVTILHVVPKSRAQKLGVEPLDVITKVNGRAVGDAKDLRQAVTEAKPPLVMEGTRDGKPLKLEEKAEAEKP